MLGFLDVGLRKPTADAEEVKTPRRIRRFQPGEQVRTKAMFQTWESVNH